MGSEKWHFLTLSSPSFEIIDGDRGVNYPNGDDFSKHGDCLFLNTKNVTVDGFRFDQCQYITFEKDKLLNKGKLKRGDIILTTRGTVGNVAFYSKNVRFDNMRINSGMIILRCDQHTTDSQFMYWLFRSSLIQDQIVSLSTGSAQPQLPINQLKNISLFLPPIIEQRSIAATLSSLDDKIELNNRIIANLEAQAQAIFKSWFVDFEPFQDGEFEESELGLFPKGWRVGTLKDICHYSNDRVAVDTLNDETYISTENMLPHKQGFVKATSLPNTAYTTAYHSGDVLVSNIRPYFKKIVYCYGDGGCSTDVICFVANDGIPSEYVFHLLYSDSFFDFMVGGSKGTKMPRGDKQQLMQYLVVKPDFKWLLEFERVAQPMLLQSYSLRQENERLALTRDTLLPKLMSGEIEVLVEE